MRIAQIAPLGLRVPPKKYGGTERIVSTLTEELVKRGHDVTLFASGDSLTSAKLISVFPTSLVEANFTNPFTGNPLSMLNIGKAYQMQNEFDIIHDHNDFLSLPTACLSITPVLMTVHGAFSLYKRRIYEELKGPNYVSISKSQVVPVPNINYVGNVYHGLHMETYPFSDKDEGYLIFVGRISREKGVHHAIDVANYLHLPLIIAAKINSFDLPYFEEYIKPKLNQKIQWLGEVDEEERNKLMSKALAFLHPTSWREPFGLTLIEAMACGCPVIGFRRGSIPEIIIDGKTGYIVEDAEEMTIAVENIKKINRKNCRKHALENFNAQKMTDGYEAIYEEILTKKLLKIKHATLHLDQD